MWCPLHRHDQFSAFDGFGRAIDAAAYAKENGMSALALTNHGNTSGLIEHYYACKDVGIKPVLGVEAYFQPTFNKEMPQYHMTVLVKDINGYKNLNMMMTQASQEKFYRRAIIDIDLLKQYSDGLIILSGCAGGYLAHAILRDDMAVALKFATGMRRLLGNRFYLEVQPWDTDQQKRVNYGVIHISERLGIPIVMTSDSHYVRREDYPTYLMMFKVGKREPTADYSQLYIPTEREMLAWWSESMRFDGRQYLEESNNIADRCSVDLTFGEMVPKINWGMPSEQKLRDLAIRGLKRMGKTDKEYAERLKKELEVVNGKGFADYFLMVYDVVEYARSRGIAALARGSVCGSLLAFAIGFTAVDPILLETSFERFLRPNKNTLPDIDIDFDSQRRGEVISYIMQKYAGRAAQVSTFGYYKVKNLCNDLIRVMGVDPVNAEFIKTKMELLVESGSDISSDYIFTQGGLDNFNSWYPGFIDHFRKLFGQVRFIGKHAAGVAVCSDEITKFVALQRVRDEYQTCYDMGGLSKLNIIKIDCLGLANLSHKDEIERLTGAKFEYWMLSDQEIYDAFTRGETEGIFQFETRGAKAILAKVRPTNIQELVACNALNRPAPIQLGVLDEYVKGKNGEFDSGTPWAPFTQDSYGCIIYQEQIIKICHEMAGMSWDETDKALKAISKKNMSDELKEAFISGAEKNAGLSREEAKGLFDKMSLYLFNKNHGVGYTLLSFYMMWLKKNFPLEFWYAVLKYEDKEVKREEYKAYAVRDGVVVLPPHVNGGAHDKIVELDGENVVQEGLLGLKGIGEVTAKEIERCGPYTSEADLSEKVAKRHASKSVLEVLRGHGALQFNEKGLINQISRYNAKYMRRANWRKR